MWISKDFAASNVNILMVDCQEVRRRHNNISGEVPWCNWFLFHYEMIKEASVQKEINQS
jgi:hypothetical protein